MRLRHETGKGPGPAQQGRALDLHRRRPSRLSSSTTSAGKKAEDNFIVYDVKGDAWVRPSTKGSGPFHASSYESIFSYDSANDAVVTIRLYDRDRPGHRRGVYTYDPATNAWAEPLPLPADVVRSIRNGNHGFYDPGLNAYFCHFAGDSADDGTMWAYKKAKP